MRYFLRVLAIIMVVLALAVFAYRVLLGRTPARIVLTDKSILLPRSMWSSQEVALAFRDLHEVYRSTWYAQSFINIVSSGGKHMVPISCLPSAEAFETILDRLQKQVGSE